MAQYIYNKVLDNKFTNQTTVQTAKQNPRPLDGGNGQRGMSSGTIYNASTSGEIIYFSFKANGPYQELLAKCGKEYEPYDCSPSRKSARYRDMIYFYGSADTFSLEIEVEIHDAVG